MRLHRFSDDNGREQFALVSYPVDQYRRWHFKFTEVEEVDRCGFDVGAGWNPARCGNPEPCAEHDDVCSCGARATEACSYAGSQFACGQPICINAEGACDRHASRTHATPGASPKEPTARRNST